MRMIKCGGVGIILLQSRRAKQDENWIEIKRLNSLRTTLKQMKNNLHSINGIEHQFCLKLGKDCTPKMFDDQNWTISNLG